MALVISLVVLVVVSLLGAVAMRTALFQNRVSINSQMSAQVHQGAESALAAVLGEQRRLMTLGPDGVAGSDDEVTPGDPALILVDALNNPGEPRRVCVDAGGALQVSTSGGLRVANAGPIGPNGEREAMLDYEDPCASVDGRPVQTTIVVSQSPATSGGLIEGMAVGGSLVKGVVRIQAEATIPGTSVSSIHAEDWSVLVPDPDA